MRRLIWAAVFNMACAPMAWADLARPQTLDDTLIYLQDKFTQDPRVSEAEVDLDQRYLSFRINGGPLQISLPDTIHDTLQTAKDDAARKAALAQFVTFSIEAAEAAIPDALPSLDRIYPVLRPKGFSQEPFVNAFDHTPVRDEFSKPPEKEDEQSSQPVFLPFSSDMELFFVQDGDQVIEFITVQDLEQLDLTPQTLRNLAQLNLQSRNWDLTIEGGDGLHILSLDGNFETSFMLNRPFWEGVDVGLGNIVAVVAAQDLVLFVDGDVEGAIDNLRTIVDPTVNQFPNPISTTPLIWDNGIWRSVD